MSCGNCGNGTGTKPHGCNNNGGCSKGGCNRLNTFDWLSDLDIPVSADFRIAEVSFKYGSTKNFYTIPENLFLHPSEMVVVDTGSGYDVGEVSLQGELARLQMLKKRIPKDRILNPIVRKANRRDLDRLNEARSMERDTMIRARAIARTLDLDMKIGDVQYQGDRRKATFYFTANGRVDFRELIRHFAKEFRIKIEMRQIGSRQESSRIGGIGSCGRELCCSTWLTNFKSVTTQAARYQNLSINQAKLSGLCGRLKCCLNYELDMYTEALQAFPIGAKKLKAQSMIADQVKVDIFKKIMYYSVREEGGRSKILALTVDRVEEIYNMNRNGKFPPKLEGNVVTQIDMEDVVDFEDDVTGVIEIKDEAYRDNRRRKGRRGRSRKPRSKNKKKS